MTRLRAAGADLAGRLDAFIAAVRDGRLHDHRRCCATRPRGFGYVTGSDELVAVLPGARRTQWTGPAVPESSSYAVTSVDRANRESAPITVRLRKH